jgi:hypothetical protein
LNSLTPISPSFGPANKDIFRNLNRLNTMKDKAMDKGDFEQAATLDKALDTYSVKIAQKMGYSKAVGVAGTQEKLGSLNPFSSTMSSKDFSSRVIKQLGLTPNVLIEAIEKNDKSFFGKKVKESTEYKNWQSIKRTVGKEPLIDSKELIKASTALAVGLQFSKHLKGKGAGILDEQISELEDQRKVLVLADPNADTKPIDKKIAATREASDKSRKWQAIYGTAQTASLATGGSMALAKGLGLSEGAVKSSGATGLITYGVIKTLSSALGQEMPKYAQTFGDKVKPLADKLAQGDDLGVFDGIKLRKASEDFMGKYNKASEKVMGRTAEEAKKEAEDMAKGLRIKQAATEGKSGSKEYNDSLRKVNKMSDGLYETAKTQADSGGYRALQALVTGAAVTSAGYTAKQADSRQVTLTGEAAKESDAFMRILDRYPEAIAEAIDRKNTDSILGGKSIELPTRTESKLLNPEEYKQKSLNELAKIDAAIAEEIADATKKQNAVKTLLDATNLLSEAKKSLNDQIIGIKEGIEALKVSALLNFPLTAGGGMKGYLGDQVLPTMDKDLTSQQLLFKEGDDRFKQQMTGYGVLSKQSQGYEALGQSIQTKINQLNTVIDDKKTPGVMRDSLIGKRSKLEDAFDIVEQKSDAANEALKNFGNSLQHLVTYRDAIKNLNNALDSISVTDAIAGLKSMQSYRDKLDKMVGGSHPDAAMEITYEQQRMGSRVGMPLYNRESNRSNVKRATLLDTIMTGKADYKTYEAFNDSGRQSQRDRENYKAKKEDSRYQARMRPWEDTLTSYESLKQSPGLSKDERSELDIAIKGLSNSLDKSNEMVSVGTLKEELTASYNKDRGFIPFIKGVKPQITKDEYKDEMGRLDTYSNGSDATLIRREIPLQDQKKYLAGGEYDTKIREQLADRPTIEMTEMAVSIADPIVTEIGKTNELLAALLEKEGVDDGLIKSILTSDKKADEVLKPDNAITKFFKMLIPGYAWGGKITGEGGPREDKVPAMLSPGEFVIRAASAKRLGYSALEAINNSGVVPSFADGGGIKDNKYKKFIDPAGTAFSKNIERWQEKGNIGGIDKGFDALNKSKEDVSFKDKIKNASEWFKTRIMGDTVHETYKKRTGKDLKSFADGGVLTSDDVKQADNYFNSDTDMPTWSDPDSDKYNYAKLSEFIGLYKSKMVNQVHADDMIFTGNSLKGFYNELVDYENTGMFGKTMPDDWAPMFKDFEKNKKKEKALPDLVCEVELKQ